MEEFRIQVDEQLSKTVTVKAQNINDAINIVESMYRNQEIILDSSDFVGVDFIKLGDDE